MKIELKQLNVNMAEQEYEMLQGILDIDLPLVQATTKYSPAYDLKYLDTEDAATWPNHSMSRYYGINSVIGR